MDIDTIEAGSIAEYERSKARLTAGGGTGELCSITHNRANLLFAARRYVEAADGMREAIKLFQAADGATLRHPETMACISAYRQLLCSLTDIICTRPDGAVHKIRNVVEKWRVALRTSGESGPTVDLRNARILLHACEAVVELSGAAPASWLQGSLEDAMRVLAPNNERQLLRDRAKMTRSGCVLCPGDGDGTAKLAGRGDRLSEVWANVPSVIFDGAEADKAVAESLGEASALLRNLVGLLRSSSFTRWVETSRSRVDPGCPAGEPLAGLTAAAADPATRAGTGGRSAPGSARGSCIPTDLAMAAAALRCDLAALGDALVAFGPVPTDNAHATSDSAATAGRGPGDAALAAPPSGPWPARTDSKAPNPFNTPPSARAPEKVELGALGAPSASPAPSAASPAPFAATLSGSAGAGSAGFGAASHHPFGAPSASPATSAASPSRNEWQSV